MKEKKKKEREDSGDNKSIHTYTYQCFILSHPIPSHLISSHLLYHEFTSIETFSPSQFLFLFFFSFNEKIY